METTTDIYGNVFYPLLGYIEDSITNRVFQVLRVNPNTAELELDDVATSAAMKAFYQENI